MVAFFKRVIKMMKDLKKKMYNIEKVISKSGHNIFLINGYLTHSKYDPISEAEKIVGNNYKKKYCHILFGIGSGYLANIFTTKLTDDDQLLIIEPNEELLREVLSSENFTSIISNQNISYITGYDYESINDSIMPFLFSFNNRVKIILSPNFEKIEPEYTNSVLKGIKENQYVTLVHNNTLQKLSKSWQENFIKNIFYINQSVPFQNYKKTISGPVVITSGGPSLTKQLHILRKYKENLFIICAGSTINTLLANDIRPDLIVSIDGNEENTMHFEKLSIDDIPLAYSPTLYPEVLRNHKGLKIVFNDQSETSVKLWMEELTETDVGEVIGGPSVANYSLDFGLQLTSGPVCLIGQDLAFTNNMTHADGNKGQKLVNSEIIQSDNTLFVEGFFDKQVLTSFSLYSMKKNFESYIKKYPENSDRVFNCTEGGVRIKGIKQMSFADFCEEYSCRGTDHELKNVFLSVGKEIDITIQPWEGLLEKIKEIHKKNKKIKKIVKEALDILNRKSDFQSINDIRIIKKLDNADKKLYPLLKEPFLFYLFKELVFKIENNFLEVGGETKVEKLERIFTKNLALYEGIYGASDHAHFWLEELIKSIEKETISE